MREKGQEGGEGTKERDEYLSVVEDEKTGELQGTKSESVPFKCHFLRHKEIPSDYIHTHTTR